MRFIALVAAMSLAGCSTFSQRDVNQLNSLIAQGRCTEAYQLAGSVKDPIKFNNLGAVAEECEKNKEKARSYYEYAARLGVGKAAENLLRNGWAVPTNDIQQANRAAQAQSDAALTNSLLLLQAGQAKPAPIQNNNISCTTRNIGGTLKTDCW